MRQWYLFLTHLISVCNVNVYKYYAKNYEHEDLRLDNNTNFFARRFTNKVLLERANSKKFRWTLEGEVLFKNCKLLFSSNFPPITSFSVWLHVFLSFLRSEKFECNFANFGKDDKYKSTKSSSWVQFLIAVSVIKDQL